VTAHSPLEICLDKTAASALETICGREQLSPEAVAAAAGRRVRIHGAPDLLHQYRVDDDTSTYALFLVNTSLDTDYHGVIVDLLELPDGNGVELWSPLDGTSVSLDAEPVGGGRRLELDFPPAGSKLVVSRPRAPAAPPPARFDETPARIPLETEWQLELDSPNALVLDVCTLLVGGERTGPLPTWRAQEQLKRAGVGTAFSAGFEFQVAVVPERAFIAVEDVSRYELRINDRSVSTAGAHPWFDPSLLAVDITSALRAGSNRVELAGQVGIDSELEPSFVTGEFSVVGGPASFRLEGPKSTVAALDLTKEGYPFYVGRLVLSQRFALPEAFGRVFLELERLDAIGARVRINGAACGFLAWKPYLVDVTAAARAGDNELEIELATSLHNLFGPHHDRRGEVRHFVIDGVWMNTEEWTDNYFSVPVGLTGTSLLVESA